MRASPKNRPTSLNGLILLYGSDLDMVYYIRDRLVEGKHWHTVAEDEWLHSSDTPDLFGQLTTCVVDGFSGGKKYDKSILQRRSILISPQLRASSQFLRSVQEHESACAVACYPMDDRSWEYFLKREGGMLGIRCADSVWKEFASGISSEDIKTKLTYLSWLNKDVITKDDLEGICYKSEEHDEVIDILQGNDRFFSTTTNINQIPMLLTQIGRYLMVIGHMQSSSLSSWKNAPYQVFWSHKPILEKLSKSVDSSAIAKAMTIVCIAWREIRRGENQKFVFINSAYEITSCMKQEA